MGKVTSTKQRTKQEWNLKDLLGRSPSEDEKKRFAELAIERMVERSQDGLDRNQSAFVHYSEKYADRKGVSPNDVDMTLFGDMLLAIESDSTRDKVKLQIEGGENAVKAYAHEKGYPGHKHIKNGPVRKFFGLSENEASSIALQIKDPIPREEIVQSEIDLVNLFLKSIGIDAEDA